MNPRYDHLIALSSMLAATITSSSNIGLDLKHPPKGRGTKGKQIHKKRAKGKRPKRAS